MAVVSREDENGMPPPSNVNAAAASTSSAQGSTTAPADRSFQETVPTASESSLHGTSFVQDATASQPSIVGIQSDLFVPQAIGTIQVSSQLVMQSIYFNSQQGANFTPQFVVTTPGGTMRPYNFLRGQSLPPFMMTPMQIQPGQMQLIATEYPQSVTMTQTLLMQSVEFVPPPFNQNNTSTFLQPIAIPYGGTVYFLEGIPIMNLGTRALFSVRDYTSFTRESPMAGAFQSEDEVFSDQIQPDYGATWQNDAPPLPENNPPRMRHGSEGRRGQFSSNEQSYSYNTANPQYTQSSQSYAYQSQSSRDTPPNGGHSYGGHSYGGGSNTKYGKKHGFKGQGYDKSKSGQKKDKSKYGATSSAAAKEQASVAAADAAADTTTATPTPTKLQRASSWEGKGQVERRERTSKGTWADVAARTPPAQKSSKINDSTKQDLRAHIQEREPSSGDAASLAATAPPSVAGIAAGGVAKTGAGVAGSGTGAAAGTGVAAVGTGIGGAGTGVAGTGVAGTGVDGAGTGVAGTGVGGAGVGGAGVGGAGTGVAGTSVAGAGTGVASARTGTAFARTGSASAKTGSASAKIGTASAKSGTASAKTGTASSRISTASARTGTDSARTGTDSARTGTDSARTGTDSARTGTDSARTGVTAAGTGVADNAASAANGNGRGPSTSQDTTTPGRFDRSRTPHQNPQQIYSQELEDVEQQLERTALRNALQVLEEKDDALKEDSQ